MSWAQAQAVNRQRTADAGIRDAGLAGRIMASPEVWGRLSERQKTLVSERHAHPGKSWAALADHMGQTKSQVWTVWRRLTARPGIRELA